MNANNDEGKLISGKEAYRLIGDGVEIEARVELKENLWQWEDAKHLPACDILNDGFDFRLKPRTITINGIEVPAPFDPKLDDKVYVLSASLDRGYGYLYFNEDEPACKFGCWRTEEEITQVVAALRRIFGGAV